MAKKGHIPWNKGLTKETHPSLKSASDKMINRVVSKETGKKISQNKERAQKIRDALMGRVFSDNSRQLMSDAKKGNIPWNKGLKKETDVRVAKNARNMQETVSKKWENKSYEEVHGEQKAKEIKDKLHLNCPGWKHTDETKQLMSLNSKGKNKGGTSWNKDLTKETDERVNGYSKKLTGLKRSEETRERISIAHMGLAVGSKSGKWKGGQYPIKSPGWHMKRKKALKRANHKSELSGRTGKLEVHHMISRRTFCNTYFNLMYNGIIDYNVNNLISVMVKKRRNQNIIPLIYPTKLFVEFDEPSNLIVLTINEHRKYENKLPSFFFTNINKEYK